MIMVIRDVQRAALQLDTDMRWYEGQLSMLYPPFAEASAPQRQRWVHEGVARATVAGLGRDERLQFLCFEQTFQPGCLEEPGFDWAHRLLTQPGVAPGERMKALRHETVRRLLQAEESQQQAELDRVGAAAEAAEEALSGHPDADADADLARQDAVG